MQGGAGIGSLRGDLRPSERPALVIGYSESFLSRPAALGNPANNPEVIYPPEGITHSGDVRIGRAHRSTPICRRRDLTVCAGAMWSGHLQTVARIQLEGVGAGTMAARSTAAIHRRRLAPKARMRSRARTPEIRQASMAQGPPGIPAGAAAM